MDKKHSCDKCAGAKDFDAQVAYGRLSRKYEQLAALMARYMSQAGVERGVRVQNALTMASEAERIVGGVTTTDFPECCLVSSSLCGMLSVHKGIIFLAIHLAMGKGKFKIPILQVNDGIDHRGIYIACQQIEKPIL